ncbi:hypothetical protein ACFXN1_51775, partial [Nocardia sp. NPDC059154]
GLAAWILDFIPGFDLGHQGLVFNITSAASFIVLLIFIPGVLGVALGRWLAGRDGKKQSGTPAGTAPDPQPAGV